jgi:serine/threonine-protein kinase
MSKILSLLGRDHLKLAESYLRSGDKIQAAGEYAKAGDHKTAARLAGEAGDEPALVRYTLSGALGELPAGHERLSAREAGELLAERGHLRKAIALFEQAGDCRRAAVVALRLGQVSRAAQLFEKARVWPEAALYYEKAELPGEALRVLQQEAAELVQQSSSRARPEAFARLEDVNLKRAEMLIRLNNTPAALNLLRQVPASGERARLLEKAGQHVEAVTDYLELGLKDEAARLARSSPEGGRLEAMSWLRAGRPREAADLFARAGRPREAAEAYEAAEEWAMAAYRWEAAEDPVRGGENYLRAGRPRDAIRCFLAAGRSDLAAAACAKSGNHATGAAMLVQAGKPLEAAGLLLSAGEVVKAARILDQVASDLPGFGEMVLAVVSPLLKKSLPAEALALIHRVPVGPLSSGKVTPATLDRLYWEARALEDSGQEWAAQELYRRVTSLQPDHRDAILRLSGPKPSPTPTPPPAPAPTSTPAAIPAVAVDATRFFSAEVVEEIAPGSRLAGRYDILSQLGEGGMGRVFKARDRELDELVAIKIMGQTSTVTLQQERLLREVQICRRISHPNVVRVFDLGRFSGGIFVTMELLQGQTLEQTTFRGEPLPFERIRQFLSEITTGLQEAHALGIVHRDLKPANIFVTERGLKILDFGIARMTGLDAHLTQTGLVFGSPAFMSPEHLLAQPLDGRADLYSLGVVAYWLISGQVPFRNDNPNALALAHLHEAPADVRELRPDTPAPWQDFVARLLAKKPQDRFPSAREVLAALASFPAPPSQLLTAKIE